MVDFGLKAMLTLCLFIKRIFTANTNCLILAKKFNVKIELEDGYKVIETSTFRTQISIKERIYTVTLDFGYTRLYIPGYADELNAQTAKTDALIHAISAKNTDMTRKAENKSSRNHLHGNDDKFKTHSNNYGALPAAMPSGGNILTSPHHGPHSGMMKGSTARSAGESDLVPHGVKAENADFNEAVNLPEISTNPVQPQVHKQVHEVNNLPNDTPGDVPDQPIQYVAPTHVKLGYEVIHMLQSMPMSPFQNIERYLAGFKRLIRDDERPSNKRRKTQHSEKHVIKSVIADTRPVQILIEGKTYTLSRALISSTYPKELDLTHISNQDFGAILGLGFTNISFVNTVLGYSPMDDIIMSLFLAQEKMNVEVSVSSGKKFRYAAERVMGYMLSVPTTEIRYGKRKILCVRIVLDYQTPYIWLPPNTFEMFLGEAKYSSNRQLKTKDVAKYRKLIRPFTCDKNNLANFPKLDIHLGNYTIHLNAGDYIRKVHSSEKKSCLMHVGLDKSLTNVRVGYILLETYSVSIRYRAKASKAELDLKLRFDRLPESVIYASKS